MVCFLIMNTFRQCSQNPESSPTLAPRVPVVPRYQKSNFQSECVFFSVCLWRQPYDPQPQVYVFHPHLTTFHNLKKNLTKSDAPSKVLQLSEIHRCIRTLIILSPRVLLFATGRRTDKGPGHLDPTWDRRNDAARGGPGGCEALSTGSWTWAAAAVFKLWC